MVGAFITYFLLLWKILEKPRHPPGLFFRAFGSARLAGDDPRTFGDCAGAVDPPGIAID